MEHSMENGNTDRNDDSHGKKNFNDVPVPVGINKVFLLGSLYKDPVIRYFDPERMVANLTLATKKTWKDRATGKWKEGLEFHRSVCYDGLAAEAKRLREGDIVCIEGSMRTMKFQDKVTGADRYMTEVVVNKLTVIGNINFSGEGVAQQASISIPLRNAESSEDAVISTVEEWNDTVRRKNQPESGFVNNKQQAYDYNPSQYNPPLKSQSAPHHNAQVQNAQRPYSKHRDNAQEEFGGYDPAFEPKNGTDGIPF